MKISHRITRVALALLLFGLMSSLLPENGAALADSSSCGSSTTSTQVAVLGGMAAVTAGAALTAGAGAGAAGGLVASSGAGAGAAGGSGAVGHGLLAHVVNPSLFAGQVGANVASVTFDNFIYGAQ